MAQERLEGFCLSWRQDEDNASGVINVGSTHFRVAGSEVESDPADGRVFLICGEPVSFTACQKRFKNTGQTYRAAVNVKRTWMEHKTIDLKTYREIVKVKDYGCKWLIRQSGGLLSVSLEDRDVTIPCGAIVQCSIRPNPGFQTWRGYDLKLLTTSENDFDWDIAEAK